MARTFGKASDFYRIRIITLEEYLSPDFDWRDDVLYRAPKDSPSKIKRRYTLQVVDLDSRGNQILKEYAEMETANRAKQDVLEDLDTLTKMQFEKKYDIHFEDETSTSGEDEGITIDKIQDNKSAPRNFS